MPILNSQETLILEQANIDQKIVRMAYEVIEENHDESKLILIGIEPNGYKVADKLMNAIKNISDIHIDLYSLSLDKAEPVNNPLTYNFKPEQLNDQVCILVDDVGNTGRTLFYASRPFMKAAPRKMRIAVLVDRSHKRFPIRSDYVGLPLSTTLKEHVVVKMEHEEAVYLEE